MTADRMQPAGPQGEPHCDIESLIQATHAELCGIAYRFLGNKPDAEEAVQNACVKLLRCWPRMADFAAARQRAYLIAIVTNEALLVGRQNRARALPSDELTDGGWMPEFPGGSAQEARDRLRRVWEAISRLPEKNQKVVALHAAGYEYPEIAEMLNLKVSTVASHVSTTTAPSNRRQL
jgi:RNA polymerase sigma factor (sigma-70 family)